MRAVVLLAAPGLALGTENIISVDLCPPYMTTCQNTWVQIGGAVGDPCTAACQVNAADQTRWCPSGADHTGAAGTPWGWCAATAAAGEASAAKGGNGSDEDDYTLAIGIIGVILFYAIGGIGFNYHTKQQMRHPHAAFWVNVGGMVIDGVKWSKAKADGNEYKAIPTSPNPTVVHTKIDDDVEAGLPGGDSEGSDAEEPPASPRPTRKAKGAAGAAGAKKKKKKKKPTAEVLEAAEEDGGME